MNSRARPASVAVIDRRIGACPGIAVTNQACAAVARAWIESFESRALWRAERHVRCRRG
ncbi:hypothetical protein [Mycolicibacterium septicum]|uniref:hypothetical protein n=1 Tax=Mycolicibacterium septicum TaxID=98668 RepID=UPI00235E8D91|nr:hypothetical protein [Mycolicibacterium septicum]